MSSSLNRNIRICTKANKISLICITPRKVDFTGCLFFTPSLSCIALKQLLKISYCGYSAYMVRITAFFYNNYVPTPPLCPMILHHLSKNLTKYAGRNFA